MVNELKERRGPKTSAELSREIADLLLDYIQAGKKNWRDQELIWEKIKKAVAKYRIATAREKKRQKETLL